MIKFFICNNFDCHIWKNSVMAQHAKAEINGYAGMVSNLSWGYRPIYVSMHQQIPVEHESLKSISMRGNKLQSVFVEKSIKHSMALLLWKLWKHN